MKKLLIFGGTIEGRTLVEQLLSTSVEIHVCVATQYGADLLPKDAHVTLHVGRLETAAMQELIEQLQPVCCVDATHPYATLVTQNVSAVCETVGCPYIRLARVTEQDVEMENCYRFDSVADATQFLATTEGNIFVTTGSKELDKYTVIPDYKKRVIARVLPTAEVLEKCEMLGINGANLIAKQGPFSEEENYEMLCSSHAKWLVTKCTGVAGGYKEKCEAALRAGAGLVLIGRPEEPEDAVDFDTAVSKIYEYIGDEYGR